MTSLVSIIIPCYNQELYIEQCLQSVLNQKYKNWECIIINDGSKDNSEEVIKSIIANDNRFTYRYIENSGVSNARNFAIHLAKGKYILPLDGDDKIGENYLKFALDYFALYPTTKLVYCKAELFGNIKQYWDLPPYDYDYFLFQNIIFCSGIYKKEDYLKTSGYDINLKIGYEDWDFWIQLLEKDDNVAQLDSIQFYYRQNENSRNSFLKNEDTHNKIKDYIYKKNIQKYLEISGYETDRNKFDEFKNILETLKEQNQFILKLKKTASFRLFYKIEKEFLNSKRRLARKWNKK